MFSKQLQLLYHRGKYFLINDNFKSWCDIMFSVVGVSLISWISLMEILNTVGLNCQVWSLSVAYDWSKTAHWLVSCKVNKEHQMNFD